MNDFQAFQVRAWLDNGLTKHVKALRVANSDRRSEKRSQLNIVLPLLASAGIAVSVFSVAQIAAPDHVSWPVYLTNEQATNRLVVPRQKTTNSVIDPDLIVSSPSDFWARQIEKVRHLTRNTAQDVQDPPAIF